MPNLKENVKEKIGKITELELLEDKIIRINRIRANKIKEIIRKGLKELEIKRINKIKQLKEIGIELTKLKAKIIIERMKEALKEFEIKTFETDIENKTGSLKQTQKIA